MSELETRELRYFLALAEELHFGRAADRLSVTQPALSRTIRQIESRLGVILVDRSHRQVRLTPSGEALLQHGRRALDAVAAAVAQARSAGHDRSPLRLVVKRGGDARFVSSLLALYAATGDARPVDVIFGGPADRADHVRDGRADVALLYAPYDDLTGLDHETLEVEGRVVIVRADHRLAGRAEVRMADLAHETLPRWKHMPGPDVPGGGTGPEIGDAAEMIQMITLGRTIALLPQSLVEPPRAGLVHVPVVDAVPSRLVLAWAEHDRRRAVRDFVAAAVAARPADLGRATGAAGTSGAAGGSADSGDARAVRRVDRS